MMNWGGTCCVSFYKFIMYFRIPDGSATLPSYWYVVAVVGVKELGSAKSDTKLKVSLGKKGSPIAPFISGLVKKRLPPPKLHSVVTFCRRTVPIDHTDCTIPNLDVWYVWYHLTQHLKIQLDCFRSSHKTNNLTKTNKQKQHWQYFIRRFWPRQQSKPPHRQPHRANL